MNTTTAPRRVLALLPAWRWLAAATVAALAACSTPPPAPAPTPVLPPMAAPIPVEPEFTGKVSAAHNLKDYKRDAAQHIYDLNGTRIYRGKMPPLLQAVGVLQLYLDNRGEVRKLEWMRAPSHVPAVMAEIERTVRAAAPYPAPRHLGQLVYTETWLWDKSGRFQLDTLTEGQR